jgi:hypothetical protein
VPESVEDPSVLKKGARDDVWALSPKRRFLRSGKAPPNRSGKQIKCRLDSQ